MVLVSLAFGAGGGGNGFGYDVERIINDECGCGYDYGEECIVVPSKKGTLPPIMEADKMDGLRRLLFFKNK